MLAPAGRRRYLIELPERRHFLRMVGHRAQRRIECHILQHGLLVHFLALGLAIEGAEGLEEFLRWSDQPLVLFAEWGLVVLLGTHMAFGLRVLAIEFLPWPGFLKRAIGLGAGAALLIGVLFLVNVG